MNNQHTRRGQTQEIIYKNCHCKFNLESHHVLFSKVRSRIKYGMTALYTPSPVLRTSSPSRERGTTLGLPFPMRGKVAEGRMRGGFGGCTARGFTLIELLVVVLIIGILAAVALPQYQKAVVKSRFTEAMVNLKAIAQAKHAYELEHGPIKSLEEEVLTKDLDIITIPFSKYFDYDPYPDAAVANAYYKIEDVCLCYENNHFIVAQSECEISATPTLDYSKLLNVDARKAGDACACC